MKKKWIVNSKAKALKIEEILKTLLKSRGFKTKKQIDLFLNPLDPYSLNPNFLGIKKEQIKKAIKRIKKAIKEKENIIIYGDYDADGICATAILWETLHSLGAKVMPFIPQREEHGYGLNKKGIDSILDKPGLKKLDKPGLIITVDNGIVANSAVDYANKKGVDVIISDHHQPRTRTPCTKTSSVHGKSTVQGKPLLDLPKAKAIIWSDQVSGAGVAWFLAKEIYKNFHKNLQGFKASNSLELACIGTITDQMPVLDINRSLIKFGLKELQNTGRPGILALCAEAGVEQKQIGAYEIGYIIGPRLNAMGRLENALDSLRLLCTNNKNRANDLASKLGLTNRQRQQLTETVFEHARKSLKLKAKSLKLIFVSHPSYNQGIIGLVASKLVEEFYKPAVVISENKEFSKGSARSIKGFNLIKALRKIKNFEDLGGHPMAAGFTVKTKKIKELKEKLEKLAKKQIKDELLQPKINIDLELDLNSISLKLADELEKFAPFGIGNPRSVFAVKKAKIINTRTVGRDNQHLKLFLYPGFEAIAFGFGALSKNLNAGDLIDVCFNINKNVWNDKEKLELRIKDLKNH